MITTLRRWIARAIALAILVLTFGRVSVEWDGVGAVGRGSEDRPAIGSTVEDEADG